MPLFARIIQKLLQPIFAKLDLIAADIKDLKIKLTRMEKRMAATEQELDSALERLRAAQQNAADRVNAKLDALQKQIADLQNAQGQPVDLSDEITSIQEDIDSLAAIAPDDVTPPPPPDGGQIPNNPVDTGEPIESTG